MALAMTGVVVLFVVVGMATYFGVLGLLRLLDNIAGSIR